MRILYATPGKAIHIGNQGESNATKIKFDVSDWLKSWPTGVISLRYVFNSAPSTVYPAVVVVDSETGTCSWTITASQTSKAEYGQCMLMLSNTSTGVVIKSSVYDIYVTDSVENGSEPPEQFEEWLEQLEALAATTTTNAAAAAASATSASGSSTSAKSWAVGGTSSRTGEDTNNSQYFSKIAKSWAVGETGIRDGENSNNSKHWATQSDIASRHGPIIGDEAFWHIWSEDPVTHEWGYRQTAHKATLSVNHVYETVHEMSWAAIEGEIKIDDLCIINSDSVEFTENSELYCFSGLNGEVSIDYTDPHSTPEGVQWSYEGSAGTAQGLKYCVGTLKASEVEEGTIYYVPHNPSTTIFGGVNDLETGRFARYQAVNNAWVNVSKEDYRKDQPGFVFCGDLSGIAGNGIKQVIKDGDKVNKVQKYKIEYTYVDKDPDYFEVEDGTGIQSIAKTSTSGLVDTYTITTDKKNSGGTYISYTFNVTNAKSIDRIEGPFYTSEDIDHLNPQYVIYFNDGTSTQLNFHNGKSAYQIARDHGYEGTEEEWNAAVNAARVAAELAQQKAETAQTKAETAQSAAETAQDSASASAITATTAKKAALQAQSDAEAAQSAAETAQGAAETAQSAAETAQGAAETAKSLSESARDVAKGWAVGTDTTETAPTATNNAKYWSGLAQSAKTDSESAKIAAVNAQGAAEDAQSAAETASGSASTSAINAALSETGAKGHEETSEAYAIGTRDGQAVPRTDVAYQNNSRYYSEKSSESATKSDASAVLAERYAIGTAKEVPAKSGEIGYQNNSKYYSEQAASSANTASNASNSAATSKADAETASNKSKNYSEISEAYAAGTINGTPVKSGETGYNNNAAYYSGLASQSATNASVSASNAATKASEASASASDATAASTNASGFAVLAEEYARGTKNSQPVTSTDPGYNDNALYYKNVAQKWATGSITPGTEPTDTNNAAYWSGKSNEYSTNAFASASSANESANTASAYASNAAQSATSANDSKIASAESQQAAQNSANSATLSATTAHDWAIGPNGTTGEPSDTNNAKYYADQAKAAITGVASFNARSGHVVPQHGDYFDSIFDRTLQSTAWISVEGGFKCSLTEMKGGDYAIAGYGYMIVPSNNSVDEFMKCKVRCLDRSTSSPTTLDFFAITKPTNNLSVTIIRFETDISKVLNLYQNSSGGSEIDPSSHTLTLF